jgi:putative protease
MHELLVPAGDMECLRQAVYNGCDAVYLACKNFGARKFAKNFDNEEIIEALKFCHLYGVKVYVTMNTLVKNNEVDTFLDQVDFLHKNGVDALIMQDFGMICLVREMYPNLEIHASTQAHTHNIEQIKLLETLGVTRVVVAREMSLDEIKKLDTKLEIEAFIHGALCVCYSGECLFSSMLLNRSGNRGACAGICRLPFTLIEDDKKIKTEGNYLLSTQELNTMDHIKELLESNITSFKIEGRMKGSITIGFITRLYRNLIDHYLKGEKIKLTSEEEKKLLVLFNREYTSGYLFNNKDIMNIKSPNHIGIKLGKVIDVTDKKIKIKLFEDINQEDGIRFMESKLGMIANFIYDEKDNLISGATSGSIIYLDNKIGLISLDTVNKTVDSKLLKELDNYEEKKIPIDIDANISDTFSLTVSDGTNTITKNSDIVETATGSGTSKDRIIEQLSKLGGTPFIVNKVNISMNDNIFVPISKLNELRREVIDELISIRENSGKEVIINDRDTIEKKNSNNSRKISVLVRTKEQLETCLEEKVDYIYVTDKELYDEYKNNSNIYLRLSRVISKFKDYNNYKLLVGETGAINKYKETNEIVGDYYLNVVNASYIDYLRKLGLSRITLSVETDISRIEDIVLSCGNSNLEVIVYGRLEVMIMKYMPLDKLVDKDLNKKYSLKDRNGAEFRLVEEDDLTHIFYYKNYDLEEDIPRLIELGIENYRIELFEENKQETVNLIKKYKAYIQ